jgi:ribose 5-phosphate isomerase A
MDELKKQAAVHAVREVRSGMVLGLGTGSTTAYAVAAIGETWRAGALTDVVGIPTSDRTAEQARSYGIPLSDLTAHPRVDLAIDGADEVDPSLDLIKGLGGALLREKQVELAAARFIVIVDDSKLVERLGSHAPLPVEVERESWRDQIPALAVLGCQPVLRGGEDQPFVTDNGNYILDCRFAGGIDGPEVAAALDERPGVLAHGLFLGMASEVVVAGAGGLRVLTREPPA